VRAWAIIAVAALTLAGCATEQATVATTVRPGAPPEPMAGRWIFASGPGQCGMNFGAASPESSDGTIAPESGCPANFYASRKWSYEQNTLVLREQNGTPLGQLTLAGPSRFEGKATNGPPITLAR
jgi:hypothetical protein